MASPIRDSKLDDVDRDAYSTIPRGSRGKLTTENSEIFMASGQNFLLSTLILTCWGIMKLLELLSKNPNNRVLIWLTLFYQTLFGMVFVDYQLISCAEIAMFDFSNFESKSFKFTVSYFLSISMLFLIISEFIDAFSVLKSKTKNLEKSQKAKIEKLRKTEKKN